MGEVFAGRFELVEPIAEGGMGSVWVIRDHRDGRHYAGKLLRQSDSAALLRFMREQSTRIEHPHVVTPLSWAGEDDRVLFTMPLVRGGSVATLVGDHGPLPLPWAVELLDQLLAALEAVHARGIVHRDVKPANLLLHATGGDRPHLLLTDFGIASDLDAPRLTRASQVIGSPGYMAPEQLDGEDPDVRQDVYAAGMVGLEMLTGARPGRRGEVDDERVPADAASRALLGLLREATDPDPARRTPSVAALRAALARLRAEHGVPAALGDPEGVWVHTHLGGPSPAPSVPTPTPTPVDDVTRVRSRPTGGAASGTASGTASGDRARRVVAAVLLVLAAVCLLAAGWFALG